MKTKIISLIFIGILIYSCTNNDDSQEDINSLFGTKWINVNDDNQHFTFISSTEYVYKERLGSSKGKYTFDGNKGVMIEESSNFELDFRVNGNVLSANQDTTDPDFEQSYLKQ